MGSVSQNIVITNQILSTTDAVQNIEGALKISSKSKLNEYVSINTGFIRVNTQTVTLVGTDECNCACKDGGGNVVGTWTQGDEICEDACCNYDCDNNHVGCVDVTGDISQCCRNECNPGDPGTGCGQNCYTDWYCTSGDRVCETCDVYGYGSVNNPQF